MTSPVLKKVILGEAEADRQLEIEVERDRARKVITLHMLEFDADLVADFVQNDLPWDFHVRVDDALFEHTMNRELYELVIALAGRHHPVRFHYLANGQTRRRLGDPDADIVVRCRGAMDQLLPALAVRGLHAIVAAVDRHGRPLPIEGAMQILVRVQDLEHEGLQTQIDTAAQAHGVPIHVATYSTCHGYLDQAIEGPHFAWDLAEQRVVLRNWIPA